MTRNDMHRDDEFVTIIGTDADEISRTFCAQGLADQEFSIVHRMGKHRFAFADGEQAGALFDGRPLVAATFARRTRT